MSREQITAEPAAPAPSAPPTIDVNKHGSARLPAGAAEVDEETSTLIIAAGYVLTTPPRHVAVALNAGLSENRGSVSANGNTELPIEVPNVPGLGGLGVNAGEQARVTASSVALRTIFSSCSASILPSFYNNPQQPSRTIRRNTNPQLLIFSKQGNNKGNFDLLQP